MKKAEWAEQVNAGFVWVKVAVEGTHAALRGIRSELERSYPTDKNLGPKGAQFFNTLLGVAQKAATEEITTTPRAFFEERVIEAGAAAAEANKAHSKARNALRAWQADALASGKKAIEEDRSLSLDKQAEKIRALEAQISATPKGSAGRDLGVQASRARTEKDERDEALSSLYGTGWARTKAALKGLKDAKYLEADAGEKKAAFKAREEQTLKAAREELRSAIKAMTGTVVEKFAAKPVIGQLRASERRLAKADVWLKKVMARPVAKGRARRHGLALEKAHRSIELAIEDILDHQRLVVMSAGEQILHCRALQSEAKALEGGLTLEEWKAARVKTRDRLDAHATRLEALVSDWVNEGLLGSNRSERFKATVKFWLEQLDSKGFDQLKDEQVAVAFTRRRELARLQGDLVWLSARVNQIEGLRGLRGKVKRYETLGLADGAELIEAACLKFGVERRHLEAVTAMAARLQNKGESKEASTALAALIEATNTALAA